MPPAKAEQAVSEKSAKTSFKSIKYNGGPVCDKNGRLERRTSRAGRDSVDHPPGSHDDRANAVAGVVAHMAKKTPVARVFLSNKVRRKYKGAA